MGKYNSIILEFNGDVPNLGNHLSMILKDDGKIIYIYLFDATYIIKC